jgi:hypothetical protein
VAGQAEIGGARRSLSWWGEGDLSAGDAHVEHAGDEHVEIAAGHLTREPDEGENGDEGCTREAEAQLEQVVVEEEVVDHGVAEGNQGHQDAESYKLPVLLPQQHLITSKLQRTWIVQSNGGLHLEHAYLQTTPFLRNLLFIQTLSTNTLIGRETAARLTASER